MPGEKPLPRAAEGSKVFKDEDAEWITSALKAGLPIGHIEFILVMAMLHERKPKEIQDAWMDCHVGVQQVFREL